MPGVSRICTRSIGSAWLVAYVGVTEVARVVTRFVELNC